MPLEAAERRRLLAKAKEIRKKIVGITHSSGSGHVGGSLSQCDALVALYYKYLRHDPKNPEWADRDRFVLSKGHGGLGHAAILGDCGYFPENETLKYGKTGSRFGMHMDRFKVPGVEASTGSLAHGFAIALGMALGAKLQGLPWHTYCLVSDGECQEGTLWEAAMAGPNLKLGNFTLFVDRNRLTIDGFTEQLMPLEPLHKKFEAFGWRTVTVDGHDYDQLCDAIDGALGHKERPTAIICETVKGKGIDFAENVVKWHYGGMDDAVAEKALESIERYYAQFGL